MASEQEVLNGPDGLQLILDPSQIFPDDPGNGTPALVTRGKAVSTYWCALGEGCLDGGRDGEVPLSDADLAWLVAQEIHIDNMYAEAEGGLGGG